ncbi:VanZ family protein [Alcanivorax sp. S6407]|uniref:VanZ family protein n=1 Tax=Alcanivorax sp. S6407 TaxID=2926424 RepID=UPI001FF544D3|nr:VanZ family protein [Alcanivorax sp. S6407]MCK0152820.1 VanZ family protein [Alcanivorax sp. S6407]
MMRADGKRLLLLLVAVAFVGGALLPGKQRDTVGTWLALGSLDVSIHVFFCALVTLLVGLNGVRAALAVMGTLLLGAGIEFAQLWIPGRSASLDDLVGNAAGVLIGLLLLWAIKRFWIRGKNG